MTGADGGPTVGTPVPWVYRAAAAYRRGGWDAVRDVADADVVAVAAADSGPVPAWVWS